MSESTLPIEFDGLIAQRGGQSECIDEEGSHERAADRLVHLQDARFVAELKELNESDLEARLGRVVVDVARRLRQLKFPYGFRISVLASESIAKSWDPKNRRMLVQQVARVLANGVVQGESSVLASAHDRVRVGLRPHLFRGDDYEHGSLLIELWRDERADVSRMRGSEVWNDLSMHPKISRDVLRIRELIKHSSKQLRASLRRLGESLPAVVIVRVPLAGAHTLKDVCFGDSIWSPYHCRGRFRGFTHDHKRAFLRRNRRHVSAVCAIQHLELGIAVAIHNPLASEPVSPTLLAHLLPKLKQYAWPPEPPIEERDLEGMVLWTAGAETSRRPWLQPDQLLGL